MSLERKVFGGGPVSASQLPSSVVTDSRLGTQTDALYGHLSEVEQRTPAFTLYVDNGAGSDTNNNGKSPGQAFATLTKAISTAQQAGQGAKIVFCGIQSGNIDLAAPVDVVVPLQIEAPVAYGAAVRRTFATANSRSVWDAVTTAAGTTVSSASAAFVAGDVNAIVQIFGAGTGGGTYYDFISSVTDGSHVVVSNGSGTAVARPAATDTKGIKLTITRTGDQGRIVTDAGIVSGQSVITSAAAAFTSADIGTAVVIAGAGQGGQALRSAIKSVSGNTATIVGVASATVTNKRCAIGVNFGDLFAFHSGLTGGGLRNLTIRDDTIGNTSVGAAVKLIVDDSGSGSQTSPNDLDFPNLRFTSADTAGAWEHEIDIDGSWNQFSGGPGVRRANFPNCRIFGARRPAETIRINGAVHVTFEGGGLVGTSPISPAIAQGMLLLDAQKSASGTQSTDDVIFSGYEAFGGYFYCEGLRCGMTGTVSPNVTVTGHRAIEFGANAQFCFFKGVNAAAGITAACADEYDAGTSNVIETNTNKRLNARKFEGSLLSGVLVAKAETFPRQGFTSASQTIGSSGVLACFGIWLPGGLPLSKVLALGGGTALAWGSSWTGQHFLVGLYDPDGNLFAQSNDLGGTAVVSNAFNAANLVTLTKDGSGTAGSSFSVPRSGLCYIGYLINSGTGGTAFTYPSWGGVNGSAASNAGPVLAGTNGSALTSLPPGPITVAGAANQAYAVVG